MSTATLPKNVLVTGANGGIGRLTCQLLVADGVEHLVMAGRSSARVSAARDSVLSATGAEAARVGSAAGFDMLDPDAVRAAVDALPAEPFDTVFLQAGGWVVADDYQTVAWNDQLIERTVFLNVFGAHATLKALSARGLLAEGCRVVIIGGEGARGIPGMIARPEIEDADDLRDYVAGGRAGKGGYTPVDALGYAKLMVWAGRAQWPEAAARKCADCLLGRIGGHGDLIGAPEGAALGALTDQKPLHPAFTDARLQQALWAVVEETVGPLRISSAA